MIIALTVYLWEYAMVGRDKSKEVSAPLAITGLISLFFAGATDLALIDLLHHLSL